MSWLRRSRPSYAVDGVEPHHGNEGWELYSGTSLAGRPVVAAALARLPQHPVLEFLLDSIGVGTDGTQWSVSFGDESLEHFGLLDPAGGDTFEETLAAAAFTDSVERADREVFVFTTTGPLTVDVVLARCLDVCGEVLRRLDAR